MKSYRLGKKRNVCQNLVKLPLICEYVGQERDASGKVKLWLFVVVVKNANNKTCRMIISYCGRMRA